MATETSKQSAPTEASVLFVDLDGTLIAGDLRWEMLLAAWSGPAKGLWSFLTPRCGAAQPSVAVEMMPFREDVLTLLRQQKAAGRKIVLVSASGPDWVDPIVKHVGCFDDVLALGSVAVDQAVAKLAAIERYCLQHGIESFGYVGDTRDDLLIWQQARDVYVVEPSRALHRAIVRMEKQPQVIVDRRSRAAAMFKALRPHQWAKNVLLAIPLVLAHKLFDPARLLSLAVAFVAFCACASAVYLLNDLADLAADRRHPSKRRRPFASGTLPLAYGPAMLAGLLLLAFGLSAAFLPWGFGALLAFYLVLNVLYSAWLKRKPIFDIMVLAGMYAMRVLAGGLAAEVVVSEWLLTFSLFFFLSLALVKRYSELHRLMNQQEVEVAGRGYVVSDLGLLCSMGISSGYLAVLVLALYVNSEPVRLLYKNTTPLWLVCGLLLFWISRTWFWATRGLVSEDPVVYALTDRGSLILGALSCGLLALAALGGLHAP